MLRKPPLSLLANPPNCGSGYGSVVLKLSQLQLGWGLKGQEWVQQQQLQSVDCLGIAGWWWQLWMCDGAKRYWSKGHD